KLLRVLQERSFERIGSNETIAVNINVIAAVKDDLKKKCEEGSFRSDLYYRLKEASLMIPPLRERVEDILPLIRHFIGIYNDIYNKSVTKISREAEKYFLNYSWKGNVRELKNTIKSIIPFKKNNTIDLDDLSYSIIEGKKTEETRLPTLEEYEKEYILKVLEAANFNISLAAEVLGINRPRLYRKIKFYQLEKAFSG
ncbi:MAG: sigma-54-dependent Fis family transcriptional regulator, partial [bacterium]|nr:sigma-54-dependent Fis family transcriptional regulator [bacterium]